MQRPVPVAHRLIVGTGGLHKPGLRRWSVLAVVLAATATGVVRGVGQARSLDLYWVPDDRTIVVTSQSGPGEWLRITDVVETDTSVVVGASSLAIPLPATRDDVVGLSISLREPLGDRIVIDASSGRSLDRAPCPPPDVYGCPRGSPNPGP